ncbi:MULTISPECIES: iron-sulfur cluster biosynthesis family protein [Paenibacillus]|uniref:Iron-sulfur cluster biosynthesis family protein n=1 Tax=Paenibacillus campinasensis TaxID=66347 RepID=A0A268F2M6_9BACL|nr:MULTISPECIES: iron-sulfur cluster biosynthesis family protein [Paenibacillus]MUG65951.1 iron-sulfur cluster biosynthesis family protein [Paenibacillus campinasensis]PAD79584.1 hypothetical protein CHH67_03660 [Paenibacillus campinasensis]PAK51741.1 hypothetical protein CHH75_14340 [Paenibacillus sp. 7541]
MKLQLTPLAERRLKEKIGTAAGGVRLVYDTDGCGCAVNGVPALQIIHKASEDDIAMETDSPIPFYMNSRQAVFFEEQMRLEGNENTYSFQLDSSSQNYGTNIRIVDNRD